jgi:hypothetical protein
LVTAEELDEVIADSPCLYHMAMKDSWALIQDYGLLPTDRLLELFEVSETHVHDLTRNRRPTSVIIEHPKHGQATVRDQIPLHEKDLVKCLEGGLTPLDWYKRLNERVFFWLTEGRLRRLLCAGAYRRMEHLVLKVPTRPIVDAYYDRIQLSPMNSGCTKPMPHPRGPDTFLPIDEYPYQFWKKVRRRQRGERVVELTVIGGVPDIAKYVEEASMMSCDGKTSVVWSRAMTS